MGIVVKDYFDRFDTPIAIALGYFDSAHNGHKLLLCECIASGYLPSVFTFRNNPFDILAKDKKQVFTYEERLIRLEELGVKLCVSVEFNREFMNLSGAEFLRILTDNYNIKLVVIGADYTCGKGAEMNAGAIKDYLENKGIAVKIIPLLMSLNGKLASSAVREAISNGDVERVNSMLPLPYFILGKVERGRNDGGRVLGIPTANISFKQDKLILKEGVYYTRIDINGAVYDALTNVGNHPTFDDYNYNVESFILDFSGDIYSENIKVVFISRLRDTVKFSTVIELQEQIRSDIERVKTWR